MNKTNRFTKISVLYLFMRCEKINDIATSFLPFLDDNLKGDSTSKKPLSVMNKKRGRDDEMANIKEVLVQANEMMDFLKETKKYRKDKKKQKNLAMKIKIANSLGDKEQLLKLMEEVDADSD
jgi:hypothetical protein